MRLARTKPRDDSTTYAVGVVPPPDRPAAPALDELFSDFYERMYAPALDFAERFASRVESEDAVQEAMSDVLIRWRARGPDPLSDRFFLAIVRHKVIDQRRSSLRNVSLEDAEEQLDALAFSRSERPSRGDARGDVLDLAVAALPPKRREVFLLVHEDEYTYKEAAAALGVHEGTVRTHLRMATADVRASFTAAGHVPAAPRPARLRAPTSAEDPTNV